MSEEQKDVNTEQAQAQSDPSTDEQKQDTSVSEDVKTQVSDSEKYENALKAMRQERAAKKDAEAKLRSMEERIRALESDNGEEEDEQETPVDYRSELVWLMNKDSFVKENLDLIEQEIAEHPRRKIEDAVRAVKSKLFDTLRAGMTEARETSEPPKQLNPKGNIASEQKRDVIKDALEGKTDDVDPRQLSAYQEALKRLPNR